MIKIIINTELTWEEDNELRKINTTLYSEVGGGIVTLYAEDKNDIGYVEQDIKVILHGIEDIKQGLEEIEDEQEQWAAEKREEISEFERGIM